MDHHQPGRRALRHRQAIGGPSRGILRRHAAGAGIHPRRLGRRPRSPPAAAARRPRAGGSPAARPKGPKSRWLQVNCRGADCAAAGQILRQLVARRQPDAPVLPEDRHVGLRQRRLQAADGPQAIAAGAEMDRHRGILLVGGQIDRQALVVFVAGAGGRRTPSIHSPWTSRRKVPAGRTEAQRRFAAALQAIGRPRAGRCRPACSAIATRPAKPRCAARTPARRPPTPAAAARAPPRRRPPDRTGRRRGSSGIGRAEAARSPRP